MIPPSSTLDTSDAATAAHYKSIADHLRTNEQRTASGATDVIGNIAVSLANVLVHVVDAASSQGMVTEALRVIGNLCFDHDVNRQRCQDLQIPVQILKLISTILHTRPTASIDPSGTRSGWTMVQLKLLRAAVGALLNASLTFDPVRSVLRESSSIAILLAVVDCDPSNPRPTLPIYSPSSWSRKAESTVEEAEYVEKLQLGSMIVGWSMSILSDILSEEKSTFPPNGILSLASVILSVGSAEPLDSLGCEREEAADFIDLDFEIVAQASALFESLSMESEAAKQEIGLLSYGTASESAGDTLLLAHLLDFVESAILPPSYSCLAEDPAATIKAFSSIKSAIVRAIVEAPNSDTVMKQIFSRKDGSEGRSAIVERMVGWIEQPVEGREDLLICATHLLAALGRNNEHCIAFVHIYQLALPLAKLIISKASASSISPDTAITAASAASTPTVIARPGEVVQILFGLVALLRHLSIPNENKDILGATRVMSAIAGLLKSEYDAVPPLQNAVVGAMKHLISSNQSNTLRFLDTSSSSYSTASSASLSAALPSSTSSLIEAESPLSILLSLVNRTDDVRLSSESTRLLIHLIQSLFASKVAPPSSSSPSTSGSSLSTSDPALPSNLQSIGSGIAAASFDAASISRAKGLLVRKEVVFALSELMRKSTNHSILINEAIVGLTLIASSGSLGAVMVLNALLAYYPTGTTPSPDTSLVEQVEADDEAEVIEPVVVSLSSSSCDILVAWFEYAGSFPSSTLIAVSANSTSSDIRAEMVVNGCTLLSTILYQLKEEKSESEGDAESVRMKREELKEKVQRSLEEMLQRKDVTQALLEAGRRVLDVLQAV